MLVHGNLQTYIHQTKSERIYVLIIMLSNKLITLLISKVYKAVFEFTMCMN